MNLKGLRKDGSEILLSMALKHIEVEGKILVIC